MRYFKRRYTTSGFAEEKPSPARDLRPRRVERQSTPGAWWLSWGCAMADERPKGHFWRPFWPDATTASGAQWGVAVITFNAVCYRLLFSMVIIRAANALKHTMPNSLSAPDA